MRILLDECLPHQLRSYLRPHETVTTAFAGWGGLKNGALLNAAENARYDLLITADQSLEYQQNLTGRRIAVISLSTQNWRIIKPQVGKIVYQVDSAGPGSFTRVDCGTFSRRRPKPPELGLG